MNRASHSLYTNDVQHHLHPFTNPDMHEKIGPVILDRGSGIYVIDADGNQYIEGMSGLWCASLGFSEERLVQAATAQMRKLPYYPTFSHRTNEAVTELARRIIGISPVPMSKVFFANSGSEANDNAVKLVWYHNNAVGRPKKKKIISRIGAYHGTTIATTCLTSLPHLHANFDLPLRGVLHTDCPNFYRNGLPGETEEEFATRLANSLDQLIETEGPATVAAFIAEPVMGSGGVILPPRTYFEKVTEVLRRHDVYMIADEVICGFGRTGPMFGTETYGLKPDIITCAKGLSSGYQPISCVLLSEPIYEGIKSATVGGGVLATGMTYSGHPVAAAVALEAIKIYAERDIVGHVCAVAPAMLSRLHGLSTHPIVGHTRGVGLLGAVEFVADKESKRNFNSAAKVAGYCAERALKHGLIVRSLPGDVISFCPPLIITEAEVHELFDRFDLALRDTAAWVEQQGTICGSTSR